MPEWRGGELAAKVGFSVIPDRLIKLDDVSWINVNWQRSRKGVFRWNEPLPFAGAVDDVHRREQSLISFPHVGSVAINGQRGVAGRSRVWVKQRAVTHEPVWRRVARNDNRVADGVALGKVATDWIRSAGQVAKAFRAGHNADRLDDGGAE